MVPQNNYTIKHNSLTKSSSWRAAHRLLAYGKYEWPPYISSKPNANEEWRFESSHCAGRAVLTTPSDKVCPSSLFLWTTSDKLRPFNSNPEIANARAPQTTSTPSPSMSAPVPASSSVSPWSPTTTCSRTLFSQQFYLQGPMEVDGHGKMSSGRTYNWLSNCLIWSGLLKQDHTFLRHSMSSKAWWIYALINLSLTQYNFVEFVCQQWRQNEISRIRWATKLKISSFQNFAFFDLCTQ